MPRNRTAYADYFHFHLYIFIYILFPSSNPISSLDLLTILLFIKNIKCIRRESGPFIAIRHLDRFVMFYNAFTDCDTRL